MFHKCFESSWLNILFLLYICFVTVTRNIITYYSALNILLSTLMVPVIHLDFNLRRDYIARVLCIKRDKPITVCGGKCYLASQLQKAGEQEQDTKALNRTVEISFFNHKITKLDFDKILPTVHHHYPRQYHIGDVSNFILGVFRPPQS